MSTPSVTTLPVGTTLSLQLNQDTKYAILVNKSPYDLLYSGFGNLDKTWLPSGTADKLYGPIFNSGKLTMLLFNNANISPQNAGIILVTQFSSSEPEPLGTYPVSIPSQTVIASSSVTSSVNNTGNPAGTIFISGSPSGDANNAITITNDGQITVGDAANSGHVSANGGFLGPSLGVFAFADIIDTVNNDTFIKSRGSGGIGNIQFQLPNGSTKFSFQNDRFNMILGSISRISTFTGAATGTYNHNLGITPDVVILMTHTNGSQTMGYDSENATTVHVTSFSGLAFIGVAIKFVG